jgi:hypothetical protein
MTDQQQSLEAIRDIRRMMERSSKFVSLSGLSGVAAGVCALAGAYIAADRLNCWVDGNCNLNSLMERSGGTLVKELYIIAAVTFIAAFSLSFVFTYFRSRKTGTPLWGTMTWRLFWSMTIPLGAGAFFLFRMVQMYQFELVAPGCLIFYGIALVNASKYTLTEIRYLGYGQLLLGLINLWMIGYGLYFWAAGFGVLHIVYGLIMWWKYERNEGVNDSNDE